MIFVVRLALAKVLKTAEISWRYHWFPRKHYPDLGSDLIISIEFLHLFSFSGSFLGETSGVVKNYWLFS